MRDVETERDIYRILQEYPVPESERFNWVLDQYINDTGSALDMELVTGALEISSRVKGELTDSAKALTGLDNPNSVAQLKQWLARTASLEPDSLDKQTVAEILSDKNEKRIVKEVLKIRQELYWSEFVMRLSMPVRTQESFLQYRAMAKPEQDELKDVGGFVGGTLTGQRRRNGNAGERHLITLDADAMAPGSTADILRVLSALGCAYAVYSTRKHEGAAPRLRMVMPLDVPCSAEEYEPIARRMASFIGMQVFDPTTFEPVRLMYWPSCSADSEFVFDYGDGPFVSRDGMLATYKDWRDVSEWPEVPGAAKIRDRSAKKQGDPEAKKGIVGAFCRCFGIEDAMAEFLPGTYEPCADPGRYTYSEGSTVGGAVLCEGGKFLYSHHATDPCSGKLVNAFDMVRLHMFGEEDDGAKPGTPVANLPSYRHMCEFAAGIPAVSEKLALERYEEAVNCFGGEVPPGTGQGDNSWVLELQSNPKTGKIQNTIQNVRIILEHDPKLCGKIYFDAMAERPMAGAPLPWEPELYPYAARQWGDDDDAGLRCYMELIYGITGKEKILDGLAVYLRNHQVHRLKERLLQTPWDGTPRVDTLLQDYFGAADSLYTREAMLDLIRACRINSAWLILQRETRSENSAYSSSVKRVLITRWRWGVLYLFMAFNSFLFMLCPLTNRRKTGGKAEVFFEKSENIFSGIFQAAQAAKRLALKKCRFPLC